MKTSKKDSVNSEIVKDVIRTFFKKTNLKNLGYIPRWIILAIDIFLISLAVIVTHFLLDGLGLGYHNPATIQISFVSFLIVQIFFFWRFKTYAGVVRHSTIIDAVQLFICELAVLITLYSINLIYFVVNGNKLFLSTRLFIIIILSYCFLLIFRISVKLIFEQITILSQNSVKKNTLIIGSDDLAVSIATSLITEKNQPYKVIGFIDLKSNRSFNRILDLPVLNINRRVAVLARAYKTEAVILADNNILNEEKIAIIEDCLNHNIKVLTLPPLTDVNDKSNLSAKIRNIKIEDLLERKPIILDSNKILNQIRDKVVLVSGAAGSIGSEIVCQVAKYNPKRIILVDQAETPLHSIGLEISKCSSTAEIILEISDIRNVDTLEKIFVDYKPEIVYHAAAYKHVPLMEDNPSQAIHTNVMGTKNLADLSIKYGIERFVMVSTDKAVNPSNVMGCSKRIAEKYVQSLSLHLKNGSKKTTKFITTRFGNVLGSNGSVVPLFTKQIENGGPITITHPDIIRYFMTIPEACQLVLEAGAMGNGGEIYIFDMGKPVKIIDLAKKMIKLAGLKPDVDILIKVIGLRPGEKLYEELLNDTSTTLPTYHEKIMIAQDIHEDYEIIKGKISELINLANQQNKNEIVAKMKEIVPEYKSMNSKFENLD